MKERPILFSGEMVRAILEGRKMQTRRVVNLGWFAHSGQTFKGITSGSAVFIGNTSGDDHIIPCPYGWPGDRLWVREAWCYRPEGYGYRADNNPDNNPRKWGSPIHMSRAASRITLEVVNVRVERVQDISEADAWAEGAHTIARRLPYSGDDLGRMAFSGLWEQINGPRGYGWDSNPWVWALTFKRITE